MTKIAIRKAQGTWSVRAGGAILVESRNALSLSEEGQQDVIYFPRADIAMAFLDRTDHSSHNPQKGDARYFSIVTKSRTLDNAAWSYENPTEGAKRIKDHIAFANGDEITVERI